MIGKVIHKLLSEDTAINTVVGTKIFPLVMSYETTRPSLLYVVDSVTPQYTKDGWAGDMCSFKVTSYADSYKEAIELAFAVRIALEFATGDIEGVGVEKIYMRGREEYYQFDADVYIIRLNFEVKINKYE